MNEVLAALWFFLPAGIANTAPVFANKIPGINRFDTPLDFGKKYKGQPIFGENKRWRGLLAGIVAATLVIALQKYLYYQELDTDTLFFKDISWFDYLENWVWLLGPLMGAGALIGDAVESFFKRQANVPSGNSWFPFDQIDYIIGGLLFSLLVVRLSLSQYAMVLLVYFGAHLLFSYIGYLLKLKEKPI